MAIDTLVPVANSVISPGDSISFIVDDTYTTLTIEVLLESSTEYAYDSASGGAQAGYTVSVVDAASRHTFTVTRSAGWNINPQPIRVIENETGSSATTTTNYYLTSEHKYPQGTNPYNADSTGTLLVSLDSVIVTQDVNQLDFDAGSFGVTDLGAGKTRMENTIGTTAILNPDESSTDNAVVRFHETTGTIGQDSGVIIDDSDNITVPGTVDGRDVATDGTKLDAIEAAADVTDVTNVTAAGALMDSEVDADIKTLVLPASTTISTFGATVIDDATAGDVRTTIDAARAMLNGAGVPGVATGDGYPLGTTYADTTNDIGYVLVDATAGVNVWHTGGIDTNAIHDNVAAEISALGVVTVAGGDYILIEDVSDSDNKKHILASDLLGGGTDAAAIHDDVAAEISALALVTVASGDHILIEDASDADAKKRIAASDLIGGTVDVVSNVATARLLGRTTAGSGDSEELDQTASLAFLGVEAAADVTDTANVTSAGALMDSEVDADLKTLVLPASTTISAFGATVVDDADAGAVRTTIGAGTGDGDLLAAGTVAQDAVLFTERADHVNTPATGFGEIWMESADTPPTPQFTGETGVDGRIVLAPQKGGTVQSSIPTWDAAKNLANNTTLTWNGAILKLGAAGSQLDILERTTPPVNSAGLGAYWVRDDIPTAPMFTDDTDVDRVIAAGDTTGNATKILAVNAGATNYEFVSQYEVLRFDGSISFTANDIWYSSPANYFARTTWSTAYGATSGDPAFFIYQCAPVVSYDCVATEVEFWYRPSGGTLVGGISLYKCTYEDGTANSTEALVGAELPIDVSGDVLNKYDNSTTWSSSNTISKGDLVLPFGQVTAGSGGNVYFNIAITLERT